MNFIIKHRFKAFVFFVLLFCGGITNAATLTGTYTIPGTIGGATVNNLTDLSNRLNTGLDTISGTAVFEFTMAYDGSAETLPIVFNAFKGTGNVVIRPAASVNMPLITSGNPSAVALVDFNGGHHFTFDGRPGGTGTTGFWVFRNTGTSSTYPTFLFLNGAAYDTLTYLTVLSGGGSNSVNIAFSSSTVAGGNSNNVISHNDLSVSGGYYCMAFLSGGSSGVYTNNNNSFINNNVYNFQATGAGEGTVGITVGNNWLVSGNSFYSNLTTPIPAPGSIECISFSANGTNNRITGNYIGGQQPHCGGQPWQVSAYSSSNTTANHFTGIRVSGSALVSDNVIANIVMSNTNRSARFCGIYISGGIDTVVNNTIGGPNDSIINGLYGNITGIAAQSTTGSVISNNTICNLKSDGRCYRGANSTVVSDTTTGIKLTNTTQTVAFYITNNTIYNLTRHTERLGGLIYGVFSVANGNQYILNNTIHHLGHVGSNTNRRDMSGIFFKGNGNYTARIHANSIYVLYADSVYSGSYTIINGLALYKGSTGTIDCRNNSVALGFTPDGRSLQNVALLGIYTSYTVSSSSFITKVFHNSVYLGGVDSNILGTNLSSGAFQRLVSFVGEYDSVYNNIFVNQRSTVSGTGVNYGLWLSYNAMLFSNYNCVHGNGSAYIPVRLGLSTYPTLATYSAANTGWEGNSIDDDPLFVNSNAILPDLHLQSNSPADQAGTASATYATDIEGNLRANFTPVDLGAYALCNGGAVASIILAASQDSVCSGGSVTFTATATNGGTTPVYIFYKNNSAMQSGAGNIYTVSTLAANDSVKVAMVSSLGCVNPDTAISNAVKVTITQGTLVPQVLITTADTIVCNNAIVDFTAQVVNGGTTPSYQWKKNGIVVATTAAYSAQAIAEGDVITCVVTSGLACANFDSAVSNAITMHIGSSVTPTISIQGPALPFVCINSLVTYRATVTNAGIAPYFDWTVNGITVRGSATHSFTMSTARAIVKCRLSSSAACAAPPIAQSNIDTIYQAAPQNLPIDINICNGDSFTFNGSTYTQPGSYTDTISTASGGCVISYTINLSYGTKLNRSFTAKICRGGSYNFYGRNLTAPGVYTDTLSGSNGCDTVVEVTVTQIASVVPDINLTPPNYLYTNTRGYGFQWLQNNVPVGVGNNYYYFAAQSGLYSVVVSTEEGCKDTSAQISITTVSVNNLQSNTALQLFPNPTNGNLQLQVQGVEGSSLSIKLFDAYGRMVSSQTQAVVNGNCNTQLDISAYAAGVYFVQLSGANLQVCKRVELIK